MLILPTYPTTCNISQQRFFFSSDDSSDEGQQLQNIDSAFAVASQPFKTSASASAHGFRRGLIRLTRFHAWTRECPLRSHLRQDTWKVRVESVHLR